MALEGREEPRVLLMTTITPVIAMKAFLFYVRQNNSVLDLAKIIRKLTAVQL